MHLIDPILNQMSGVAKPQRKFMSILLTALTYLPGRVNFRNLDRYTSLNEKTFSRWFRRSFDFVTFNLLSLKDLPNSGEWVAAIDASFSPKSGRTSYGLDWFWNGSQGQAERGYAKTNEAKLNFHFNASLAALNLLRLEDRQQAVEGTGRNVISIASWKTRKFNAHLLERFSCHLGVDFTAIKSSLGFAALCNYGAIAA